jgi:hypothetical protein
MAGDAFPFKQYFRVGGFLTHTLSGEGNKKKKGLHYYREYR